MFIWTWVTWWATYRGWVKASRQEEGWVSAVLDIRTCDWAWVSRALPSMPKVELLAAAWLFWKLIPTVSCCFCFLFVSRHSCIILYPWFWHSIRRIGRLYKSKQLNYSYSSRIQTTVVQKLQRKSLDVSWTFPVNIVQEPGMAPDHKLGLSLAALETRLDYMGTSILMARVSSWNASLRDEWRIGAVNDPRCVQHVGPSHTQLSFLWFNRRQFCPLILVISITYALPSWGECPPVEG